MYFEIDCHCVICGGPFSYCNGGRWSSIHLVSSFRGSDELDLEVFDVEPEHGVYDPKVLREKNLKWLGYSRLLSGEAEEEVTRWISR
jgi:hypothetical protein